MFHLFSFPTGPHGNDLLHFQPPPPPYFNCFYGAGLGLSPLGVQLLPPGPPLFLPPRFLFHYTDFKGMSSITEHNYIRKSFPQHTSSMAYFGEGVYLTAIPPEAPNYVLLRNNWNDDGLASSMNFWNGSKMSRLQYCFAISTESLYPWALEKKWDKTETGRDIWIYKCGITLSDKVAFLCRRW